MVTTSQAAATEVLEAKDPKDYIIIKGAATHNLKQVDVAIPRNKLVVVTGVSGSGKSSLTIDTLYAEGQRRYVESLSAYARQFLMRMDKPEVDYIKGICPAIAIEQKVNTRNSRSTVGTLTEIYDFLRLLFGRVGRTYSPVSGKEVTKREISDITDELLELDAGTKVMLLIPFDQREGYGLKETLNLYLQKGFTRIMVKGKLTRIEDYLSGNPDDKSGKSIEVLIDRLVIKKEDEETQMRLADSIGTALYEGHGLCTAEIIDGPRLDFSNKFERDGIMFEEPTPHFFSFNSPYGACKTCEGFGSIIGIDPDRVVPDKRLSVYEGAIACWKGEKMKSWLDKLIRNSIHFDFPIHRPYKDLDEEHIELLWTGNQWFKGLNAFFRHLEEKSYKIQYRVMLSRYRGRTACTDCKGTRIRKEASYVKIGGRSIQDLILMPIQECHAFFETLELKSSDTRVAARILKEINTRLKFMINVGLGYLTLNRQSGTLSGGETQRINLTRTLGSNLTDSLYILDEPSIGLHPKDTERLIKVLLALRDLGNTVVVVEHEEDIMHAADHIIDMGPLAGVHGGEVVAEGSLKEIIARGKSLTANYLSGFLSIELPDQRRKTANQLLIKGASQHNLKHIDVRFPLNALTVVTGVSGSGKTTLVKKILFPALQQQLEDTGLKPGAFDGLEGDISAISEVQMVDQNPIGRSSRSNPVTYVKAYDAIRNKFSKQRLSRIRGYKPSHFSFNVDGGRCETCKGEGEVIVEMQFLADLHLKCEACGGHRFKPDILEVTYKDKNISDVMDMTVDEALAFFEKEKDIIARLQPLSDVGLGYIGLGQSSSTLSGGEAQRVKLASFLGKGKGVKPILFIFDEPTTGLHFHDIHKLLQSFDALIEKGHHIVVVEHNLEVIKYADWVVDLGPEGGKNGGYLVAEGTPESVSKAEKSWTGKFLKEKLG